MSNSMCSGASNHIGCMRWATTDLCLNCNRDICSKNCDKIRLITRCFCDDCNFLTDSIECYEFRDTIGTKIDIIKNELSLDVF